MIIPKYETFDFKDIIGTEVDLETHTILYNRFGGNIFVTVKELGKPIYYTTIVNMKTDFENLSEELILMIQGENSEPIKERAKTT